MKEMELNTFDYAIDNLNVAASDADSLNSSKANVSFEITKSMQDSVHQALTKVKSKKPFSRISQKQKKVHEILDKAYEIIRQVTTKKLARKVSQDFFDSQAPKNDDYSYHTVAGQLAQACRLNIQIITGVFLFSTKISPDMIKRMEREGGIGKVARSILQTNTKEQEAKEVIEDIIVKTFSVN